MPAPAVPVLTPAWRVACVRCATVADVRCGCASIVGADSNPTEAEAIAHEGAIAMHDPGCTPPERCPRCKAPRWWEEPRWRRGEGTSRETIRRRRIARAAKRRRS